MISASTRTYCSNLGVDRNVCTIALLIFISCQAGSRSPRPTPDRIVTLTPSSTEIVAILGSIDKLVGVDTYSRYPKRVQGLPKVGNFLQPNLEAIIALQPDLVVTDEVQSKVVRALQAAKIPTLSLSMHTIGDVRHAIIELGNTLGQSITAHRVIARADRELEEVRQRSKKRSRRKRVLALVEREHGRLGKMIAAGPGSYLDELLAIVNAENVVAGSKARYVTISQEELLRSQPQVILDAMVPTAKQSALSDWYKVPMIPAVQNQEVYPIATDLFMAPSPRFDVAIGRLEAMIYGEQ